MHKMTASTICAVVLCSVIAWCRSRSTRARLRRTFPACTIPHRKEVGAEAQLQPEASGAQPRLLRRQRGLLQPAIYRMAVSLTLHHSLPEYMAKWEIIRKSRMSGSYEYDPIANCLPPGMPHMMWMAYGMEIMQTKDRITFFSEWQDALRRVYLDGRKPTQKS